MLDCTGAIGMSGSDMLSLMERAVDASELARVHSHNEEFDGIYRLLDSLQSSC